MGGVEEEKTVGKIRNELIGDRKPEWCVNMDSIGRVGFRKAERKVEGHYI